MQTQTEQGTALSLQSLLLDWGIITTNKKPGSIDGVHYTDYVEKVKQLKREKKHNEAVKLLLQLVGATENESKFAGKGWGVAPWYYEQLAIIYRKEKCYQKEIDILTRYHKQTKALGVKPGKLAERLKKANDLLNPKS